MTVRAVDQQQFLHPVCLDYDGATENSKNTTNQTIGVSTTWTISVWVKPILQSTTDIYWEIKSSVNNNSRIAVQCVSTDGNLNMIIFTAAAAIIKQYIYNNFWGGGQWTNLITTWDGTTMNVYKNGVLQVADTKTTDAGGNMAGGTRSVAFGSSIAGGNFANCRIHSAAIWNTVLAQSDITLIGGGFDGARIDARVIQPTNLQHWWLLGYSGSIGIDRGFALNLSAPIDVNTNAANMTESDDAKADAPVCNQRAFFYGHPYCLDLDGSTELLKCAGLNNLGFANNWTIMAWLKPTESVFNTDRTIMSLGNVANEVTFQHQGTVANDPWVVITKDSAASTIKNYRYNNLINANQTWQQIVVSWNGSTLTLYNGSVVTAASSMIADNAGTMTNTFRGMFAGSNQGSIAFWQGRIHSIAMWNRTLSQSEVTTIFNNGNALNFNMKSVLGLTHWWLFGTDEGVTDYVDSSTPNMDLMLGSVGITLADDRVIDYPGKT
jgi:hypothetical protein